MRWFKHLSNSLENSFISDLIDEFGAEGYMVFYGILEIMAEDFDVESLEKVEVSWGFLRRKLRLSRQKLVKILNFLKKSGRFIVTDAGDRVTLQCPKFTKLIDEYSQRLVKQNIGTISGQAPKKSSLEEEVEVDKEVDKDLKTKEVCPEPEKTPDSRPAEIFIELPLVDGSYFLVETIYIDARQESFPAVNVRQQLREMKAWLEDNPANRKTRTGIKAFITRWLSKEQNRARKGATDGQGGVRGKSTGDDEGEEVDEQGYPLNLSPGYIEPSKNYSGK